MPTADSLLTAVAQRAREMDAAWKARDEAERRAREATEAFNNAVAAVEEAMRG